MKVPPNPKIYRIVHVDRLSSIMQHGCISDARIAGLTATGTDIGMDQIKKRRLSELTLASHPGLHVGQCVPFYFCPRSIMLFVISCANQPGLAYKGGQGPTVHLEADLRKTVAWANTQNKRWAFTLSNAGAYYFEDRSDLSKLDEINWSAVFSMKWSGIGVPPSVKEGKQAEFLLEDEFPWELVERVGVISRPVKDAVIKLIQYSNHKPSVEVLPEWYY